MMAAEAGLFRCYFCALKLNLVRDEGRKLCFSGGFQAAQSNGAIFLSAGKEFTPALICAGFQADPPGVGWYMNFVIKNKELRHFYLTFSCERLPKLRQNPS
jgi:hypothetical protein